MICLRLILILFTLIAFTCRAQEKGMDSVQEAKLAEVMPEFPGGEAALFKYLVSVKIPKTYLEIDVGFKETVKVRFTIDTSGNVIEAVIEVSSEFELLNQTALAHVNNMPRWEPGRADDKPVKIKYLVPIRFVLEQNDNNKKRQKRKKAIQ